MTSSVAHFFWIQKYEKGAQNWSVKLTRKNGVLDCSSKLTLNSFIRKALSIIRSPGIHQTRSVWQIFVILNLRLFVPNVHPRSRRSSNNCLRPVVVLDSKGQAREGLGSQHKSVCPSKVLGSNEFFKLMYHTHLFLYEDRWISVCNICSTHCILQSVISSSGPLGVSRLWFFHSLL